MSNPYAMFGTDANMEKQGIELDYGAFAIRIARTGGANKRFARVLDTKMRPLRRAIQSETLDEAVAAKVMAEVFAEAVVLGWSSTEFGEGKIPGKDGEPLEFTKANVLNLFLDLPELFADVREQAGKASLFRQSELEADAKN